jgi:hypothetical protein
MLRNDYPDCRPSCLCRIAQFAVCSRKTGGSAPARSAQHRLLLDVKNSTVVDGRDCCRHSEGSTPETVSLSPPGGPFYGLREFSGRTEALRLPGLHASRRNTKLTILECQASGAKTRASPGLSDPSRVLLVVGSSQAFGSSSPLRRSRSHPSPACSLKA